MWKKTSALILLLVFLFPCSLKAVYADNAVQLDSTAAVIQYMYNCLMEQTNIFITYTGENYQAFNNNQVQKLFQKAVTVDKKTIKDNASIWGNIAAYESSVSICNGYALIQLKIDYRHDKAAMKSLYQAVDEMVIRLDEKYDFSILSEAEIIKAVHDYLCSYFDYDYTYKNDDYDGIFGKDKRMVCQGYSLLAYKILNRIGIETKIIMSKTHSWNIVKLNDAWYHLDITNDDLEEKIVYDYFLKAELKERTYHYFSETFFYDLHEISFANADFVQDANQHILKNKIERFYHQFFQTYSFVNENNSSIYLSIFFVLLNHSLFHLLEKYSIHKKRNNNKKFDSYNSL